MRDYQVGEEVNFKGQKAVVTKGDDGYGWYEVNINGKIESAFSMDINDDRIIVPGRNSQIGGFRSSGYHSNAAITKRNGGVRHQFIDSIGGCSSNYR